MAEAGKKRPRPVPVPTNITRPFWDAAKQGKLVLQRCRRCGTWQYWPRPVCVDLPEGTRMMAHLVNCPIEQVRIGLPVRVVWEKLTDEITLPQFEPAA
jgi:uncharacterized OB-fold protein